jgi:hypothetical protein
VQTFVFDRLPFGAEHLVVLFSSEQLTSQQAA